MSDSYAELFEAHIPRVPHDVPDLPTQFGYTAFYRDTYFHAQPFTALR